ncbi:4-hydroxythreonine-4-phosphate dehydrogenase PdxA [Tepidimonas taiwanensis]|uniref:4-hydroxythreonine-4-phosphate dehydrogenase 2 n=1 Tax=Tepidimonas taiwanensis TaxID=307486 RepID=A0A554XE85_9BURK|nr:4-hydroxythreonine-4-phosphate dehydrogenase PdxA [Tepidimonas taiwanensis]MDM7464076.1 4-hydroxythreonine-4-phosphate dehydrogenase PdxA [Tepidimonas taiwanensis]TSE34136.1 4-hydroxythreonine-4-phosphate dehydrogenase 2 [Tepidimonas taiwanensis]UBQ04893.1 4-hydroxythreonine-4-phosphate dehydrogenase PdxA [Tepidimonas taiwanensis]
MDTTRRAAPDAPVALTMGDAAGIGPEIIAEVFRRRPEWSARCVVIGDLAVMRRAVQVTGGALPIAVLDGPQQARDVPPRCIPLWPAVSLAALPPFGAVSAAAGRAAADAVILAAEAALRGEVAALVTAPLNKAALAAAGLDVPGHTELLQAVAARHLGCAPAQLPVRMMLSNDELRTVLVSIHVSLREAIEAVTAERVWETLRITHTHFTERLGWPRCRIAVAGLNPHAGEGGLFGREEIDAIAPAVERARAAGWCVSGPHPPDTVFMRARAGAFDVVIAMYHDQGLIPVKYLGLDRGVNTTLGLPFVRTSPDHGTAFDLAGQGRADPGSLIAALEAALSACGSAAARTGSAPTPAG